MSLVGLLLEEAVLVLRANQYQGGGPWKDESGNGLTVTAVGTVEWDGFKFIFPDDTGHFEVANDPVLNFGNNQEFTIVAAAFAGTTGGPSTAIFRKQADTLSPGYRALTTNLGSATASVRDGGGTATSGLSISNIERPYPYALRRTATAIEYIVDTTTVVDNTSPPLGDLTNTEPLIIAGLNVGQTIAIPDRAIYGIAVFDRALTDDEVYQAVDELVAQEGINPEIQFSTVAGWRALSYPGPDEQAFLDDESGTDNGALSPSGGVTQSEEQWNPDLLAFEMRDSRRFSSLGSAAERNVNNISFSAIIAFTREGQGDNVTGKIPLLLSESTGYWTLYLDGEDKYLTAAISDGSTPTEVRIEQTVPLQRKVAAAIVRDLDAGELSVYWINRRVGESTADSTPNNLGVTPVVSVGGGGGGVSPIDTEALINFYGAAICRRALTLDQLQQVAAWIDPDLADVNVAVATTLQESNWKVGKPRT